MCSAIGRCVREKDCLLYTSNGEVRYNSLQRQNPEKAARLFAKNESEAKARYAYLNKLVAMYGEEE